MELSYIQTCVIELSTTYAQIDEPKKAVEVLERYKERIKTAQFTYTYGLALLEIEQPLKALMQLVLASMNREFVTINSLSIYIHDLIFRIEQRLLREGGIIKDADMDCRFGVNIFFTMFEAVIHAAEVADRTFWPVMVIVYLHFQIYLLMSV